MLDLENPKYSKDDYNNIPVYYCKHCLSLLTSFVSSVDDSDFCMDCGSTDIGVCNIDEWEELYKKAHHGIRFLDNNY